MYKLLIREKLSKELRKLNKKNHVLFEAIFKKADEICINPQHYKNLNYPLNKCPQRNNLCNLLVIGISIGDLDCENQDVQ